VPYEKIGSKMKRRFVMTLLAIVPLLFGALLGYYIGGTHRSAVAKGGGAPVFEEARYQQTDRPSLGDEIQKSRETAITRTVGRVSPAVVGVSVIEVIEYRDPFSRFFGDDPFFRQFFGTQKQQVQNAGSGFIISPDGYIVTNDHVAGNAKEITVTMTNGEKHPAKVIGHDVVSDIALLKIDGRNLPHLVLGNSDNVMIGEWVIAFGNPFGMFEINDQPYVTVGVVSALHMNLQSDDPRRSYRNMIGTDAAINSGNSGGPLVNSMGEVIGMNTIIYTPNQGNIGLGFAIPVNRVKAVVDELRKNGKIDRSISTGISVQRVDGNIAKYFGLPKPLGLVVKDVAAGSTGERAGIRVGDIILEANGEKVEKEQDIIGILNELKVGDMLRLKVFRDKHEQVVTLRLGKS